MNKKKKPSLDIKNSLQLKNEMNYLEYRLILAFFEANLTYNTNAGFPKLSESVSRDVFKDIAKTVQHVPKTNRNRKKEVIGPNQPKPFKVNGLCFESQTIYLQYRNLVPDEERKKFLAMPNLRPKLEENMEDLTLDTRYLTTEEVETAKKNNEFKRPEDFIRSDEAN